MTDGSTTSRTGRSRKQSVKSVLCQVSKFLDGFELGSAYFVNFEELRLKIAILKMKMALLSLKKLKMALCAGTPRSGRFWAVSNTILQHTQLNLSQILSYILPPTGSSNVKLQLRQFVTSLGGRGQPVVLQFITIWKSVLMKSFESRLPLARIAS